MNKKKSPKITFNLFYFVFFLVLIFQSHVAFAEQTIISIPSSEVLPFGNLMLKESNRLSPFLDDFSGTMTPSATFGLGRGFELSTGVATTINESTMVRGNFAAKKVFFLGKGTRLTVGGSVNPYFTGQTSPDSLLYAHLSQRIKKTRTSITAGAYAHGQRSMPNNAGVLLGLEQVIIPNKLRFAMDWISGENSYAKMGVGLKYRPVPTVSITSAVIIPNEDEDKIGFNFSISKFISLKDYSLNKKETTPCLEKKNL